MAGGHGNHPVGIAPAHGHGGQQQRLRHGGARPVEPQMGDPGIAQGKGGADALVQQIPGEDQVDVIGVEPRLVQKLVQGELLHLLLRLLPGFFPESGIHAPYVKAVSKRSLCLLLSAHCRPGGDIDRLTGSEGVAAKLVSCHIQLQQL